MVRDARFTPFSNSLVFSPALPQLFFASGGAICDLTDISLPSPPLPPLHSVPPPSPSPSPPSPRFFDNKYVVIVGADKKPPYGGRGVSIGVSGGREDEQSSGQKERIGERGSEDLGLKSRWNVIAAADSGFGEREHTMSACYCCAAVFLSFTLQWNLPRRTTGKRYAAADSDGGDCDRDCFSVRHLTSLFGKKISGRLLSDRCEG